MSKTHTHTRESIKERLTVRTSPSPLSPFLIPRDTTHSPHAQSRRNSSNNLPAENIPGKHVRLHLSARRSPSGCIRFTPTKHHGIALGKHRANPQFLVAVHRNSTAGIPRPGIVAIPKRFE